MIVKSSKSEVLVRVPINDVKLAGSSGHNDCTIRGSSKDGDSFEVRLTEDEMRVLLVDFLDLLGEDEKAARSNVAKSYRRLLARG